jgi:hypothetical protein
VKLVLPNVTLDHINKSRQNGVEPFLIRNDACRLCYKIFLMELVFNTLASIHADGLNVRNVLKVANNNVIFRFISVPSTLIVQA